MDKSAFRDSRGNFITQGLFIDFNFDDKFAVYSMSDEDREYKGVVYPSLKKLYLEESDPTEYRFANKYLYSWAHWQRICANKILGKQIAEWREELEYKLRAEAVKAMREKAAAGDTTAAKWLSDKGWEGSKRGRPSKAEIAKNKAKEKEFEKEMAEDLSRIVHLVKKEA